MKIFHTADWHIGQNFYGYERREEHQHFLHWLKMQLSEQEADVLLIAGDVFDSPNPSAESQRMFYAFLYDVTTENPNLQVVVTAGNHDSAARLEAPHDLLTAMRVEVRGVIHRTVEGEINFRHLVVPLQEKGQAKAWCLAVPYLRQGDYPESSQYGTGVVAMYGALTDYLKEINRDNLPVVAMGHLHVFGSELSDNDRSERIVVGGLECVAAEAFGTDLAYVALGHLHKPQRVGGRENVRYSGSPLPMSFSEKFYKQGVNLIELDETGLRGIQRLDFQPLASLLSVPKQPLPLAEVLGELLQLPDGEIGVDSPYLEIKVLETEPEPSKRHQIEEAIKGKAVRLARIVAVTPKVEREQQTVSLETWQNIQPMEMAQDVFRQKYGTDMPEHIEKLLLEVIRETENG
ncbi:MAG: putative exonuclease [Bacteroidetes bacterium]|nr:putative exonuclease [Bacteroidota bacterium]